MEMMMMAMMMVANSLMISDSTGKSYKHSTVECEMLLNLISPRTHRLEQFTRPQAIENDIAWKGGRRGDHGQWDLPQKTDFKVYWEALVFIVSTEADHSHS